MGSRRFDLSGAGEWAMMLGAAVADYLVSCQAGGLAAGTVAAYRYALARMCDGLGDVELSAVGARDLRTWLASVWQIRARYSGELLSPSTVQLCYRAVKTFFVWCVSGGLLSADPMAGVRRPRVPDPDRRHLLAGDLAGLLDAAACGQRPERDIAVLLVMLDAGLRRAEVCALDERDLDLEAHRLTVRQGKGGKRRTVPLSAGTVYALRVWMVARPVKGPRLFGLTGSGLYQMVKRSALRAGLDISPHGLRHTFASLYAGPLDDLQKILGHASIETTLSIYRHKLDAELLALHADRSPVGHLANGQQMRLFGGGG